AGTDRQSAARRAGSSYRLAPPSHAGAATLSRAPDPGPESSSVQLLAQLGAPEGCQPHLELRRVELLPEDDLGAGVDPALPLQLAQLDEGRLLRAVGRQPAQGRHQLVELELWARGLQREVLRGQDLHERELDRVVGHGLDLPTSARTITPAA